MPLESRHEGTQENVEMRGAAGPCLAMILRCDRDHALAHLKVQSSDASMFLTDSVVAKRVKARPNRQRGRQLARVEGFPSATALF